MFWTAMDFPAHWTATITRSTRDFDFPILSKVRLDDSRTTAGGPAAALTAQVVREMYIGCPTPASIGLPELT